MRRSWPLAIMVVLALAAPAHAAPSQKKAIWGPAQVNGVSQFPIYRDLGVGIWQGVVYWHRVAGEQPGNPLDPNDPAYHWDSEIDFAVQEAARYGIKVALMVTRTPGWANGGRGDTVPPKNPDDYAKFVEAIAKRYPSVHLFNIWSEPTRIPNFALSPGPRAPNYFADPDEYPGKRLPVLNAAQRRDVGKYAQLVDATYVRVKKLSPSNLVIAGNTTTSGDIDPFNWARWLRLPNGKPPRMDLYGHNPFSSRGPNLKKDQILVGTADFSDLDILIPWIDRWVGRAGRNKRLRLFISEFTAPTDVPSYEFPFHVTRKVQAKWVTQGLRITRRWSRIYTFGWIGLRDPAPRADGRETRTGLIDARGVRKPAYYAFKRG